MDGDVVALEVTNLRKAYPGVVALDNVSMAFSKGKVHAIVGENGAGKSTLIKVISGCMAPDSGRIEMGDARFDALTPSKAMQMGIGTIYQDVNLVWDLSIAENILLSAMPNSHGLLDKRKMLEQAKGILSSLNIELDPAKSVRDISAPEMQFVAIAKALACGLRVLIFDEPTAALPDADIDRLFSLIERLKGLGIAIVYITHHLNEVFRIADEVTVMRDGRVVSHSDIDLMDGATLIELIAGRKIDQVYPVRKKNGGEVAMEVRGLAGGHVADMSFSLRKGEILGISGLVGSGLSDIGPLLFGAIDRRSGTVSIDGKPASYRTPRAAKKAGISYVPADRKHKGVLTEMDVASNLTLPSLEKFARRGLLDSKKEMREAGRAIAELGVKTPSAAQLVKNLSGGNQQKVALGKWLAANAKILILEEPTQGVDVGARSEIYGLVNALCEGGMSVIMISSDLEELMGMAGRIVVVRDGRIAAECDGKDGYSRSELSLAASGAWS